MPCSSCDSYKNNNTMRSINSYKKPNNGVKKYRLKNQSIIKNKSIIKKPFVKKVRKIFPLGNLRR